MVITWDIWLVYDEGDSFEAYNTRAPELVVVGLCARAGAITCLDSVVDLSRFVAVYGRRLLFLSYSCSLRFKRLCKPMVSYIPTRFDT